MRFEKISLQNQGIRNSGRSQSRFMEIFFFFFGLHLNLGAKFRTKMQPFIGEDHFFCLGLHLNLGAKFRTKIQLFSGEDFFFDFHLNFGAKFQDFGLKYNQIAAKTFFSVKKLTRPVIPRILSRFLEGTLVGTTLKVM